MDSVVYSTMLDLIEWLAAHKVFVLFAVSAVLAMPWILKHLRAIASKMIALLSRRGKLRPEVIRQTFNDTPMVQQAVSAHHTHGTAAAGRSTATLFMQRVAAGLGLEPYFYQCSGADQRNGSNGSREYYWAKDVSVTPSLDEWSPAHLTCLVDVDYYVDMDQFLVDHPGPVLLYTFIPDAVCGQAKGYSYTFDKQSRVEYQVSGGATYKHALWNYGVDHFMVFGGETLITSASAYLVDRRSIDANRYVVMLTPIGCWGLLGANLCRMLHSLPLVRLRVAHGDYLRLNVVREDGHCISTGRAGGYLCSTIPVRVDDTISTIARISKVDLSIPQVLGLVEDRGEAAILVDFHRNAIEVKPDTVFPVDQGIRRYQMSPESYDPDAKASMSAFMSPIIHGCFSPDACKSNDAAAVKHRISDVKTHVELTPFVCRAMEEFLKLVVPDKHELHPLEVSDVYERQNRPTQRNILDQASATSFAHRVIKMFVKREAYGDVKPPRPISTINGNDKMDYSKFIYRFADVLGQQAWYAFSHTPVEIASRVADVLCGARCATNTDFSKFDGHVSNVLRELEKLALLRAFHPQYHATLIDLHRSQFNLPATSKFGVKYETGTSRASGSPETSAFNTLANAFINYLAIRMTRYDGAFLTPEVAYRRLGIYGGDDGLTADLPVESLEKASAAVGQVVTSELVHRGKLGVKFLARMYSPNVWFGDMSSCSDLSRQLSKFHATTVLDPTITPESKLLAKSRGFVLSDPNTPILGPLCLAAVKLGFPPTEQNIKTMQVSRKFEHQLAELTSYNARYDPSSQYPNVDDGWMSAYALEVLPGFDHPRFKAWLARAKSVSDLLAPPLCDEPRQPEPKKPVVINDDVVTPQGWKAAKGVARPKPSSRSAKFAQQVKA